MNEDRELLELAAKAAGIEPLGKAFEMNGDFAGFCMPARKVWNPLTDDGDALRLAVKLKIHIMFYGFGSEVTAMHFATGCRASEIYEDNPEAAARRAIVRAAAEIGREM